MSHVLRILLVSICGTVNAVLVILGTVYLAQLVEPLAPAWKPWFAPMGSVVWLLALLWPVYMCMSGPRIAAQLRLRRREMRCRSTHDDNR